MTEGDHYSGCKRQQKISTDRGDENVSSVVYLDREFREDDRKRTPQFHCTNLMFDPGHAPVTVVYHSPP